MSEDAQLFKRGDFVRLKRRLTGSVGVVWEVQPKSFSSVSVYWRESGTTQNLQVYDPHDLARVSDQEVPRYALALKNRLGL
jgi:hypothetical protein